MQEVLPEDTNNWSASMAAPPTLSQLAQSVTQATGEAARKYWFCANCETSPPASENFTSTV